VWTSLLIVAPVFSVPCIKLFAWGDAFITAVPVPIIKLFGCVNVCLLQYRCVCVYVCVITVCLYHISHV
jgi:hypothetical protein